MKQKIILGIALLCYAFSFAQSADLDREYFKVSYVKLPSNPILEDSKRTYSSNNSSIRISGFSKVKSNGTLDLNYTFNGTQVGEVDIHKTVHEKKDDDGNVVSKSYSYNVLVTYRSTASLSVTNGTTADTYTKEYGEEDAYKSKSFQTYSKAQDFYNNNRFNLRKQHTTKHKKAIRSSIAGHLNSTYGYVPHTTDSEHLWILGSKKHPEYQKHHEAFDQVKAAFDKIQFDQPVASILSEVQPAIDYFESVIPKFPGDKRKMRKVKYASYYNIAKIYYYLDMPEKANEYAKKLIENDFDKADGKYFNRMANALLEKFEINQTKTRHFAVITEDLSNEEEEEEEEQEQAAPDIELNKAYLITKSNDTLMVDIKTPDVATIAYDLKTVEFDKTGKPFGSRVRKAKGCKELLFMDGLHFRNIAFKESSVKGGEVDAAQMLLGGATDKLCKVLFESEEISLYLFNNSETVLLKKGSEKGQSTQSAGFAFGFKKKLAKLAEGYPEIQEKANNKEYENTPESLLAFCKELSEASKNKS